MNIYEKLAAVQYELKAPKNLTNKFGGYNYRNAEGILEAFKPFEPKFKVALVVGDEMVEVGGRVYVKATATFIDTEAQTNPASVSNVAYAREPEAKKGMDEAQITGAASSYARKYALNGLLLLDDNKDPDSSEYTARANGMTAEQVTAEIEDEKKTEQVANEPIGEARAKALAMELQKSGVNLEKLLPMYGVKALKDLTEAQMRDIVTKLQKRGKKSA